MNPNAPLSREQVEILVKEAPEAVVNLVMVMQEQIAELRAEVRRLQERVAELEEQNRPPSAPFWRRDEQRKATPKKPGRAPGPSPRNSSTAGLLVSDCLAVYDTATPCQHKCYAHHLRALKTARRDENPQAAAAEGWVEKAGAFFKAAMDLKKRQTCLSFAFIPSAKQAPKLCFVLRASRETEFSQTAALRIRN